MLFVHYLEFSAVFMDIDWREIMGVQCLIAPAVFLKSVTQPVTVDIHTEVIPDAMDEDNKRRCPCWWHCTHEFLKV